ncbi:DUF1499 domain-containing protein [Halioglobus maricola]|uniref:DUF1499 domain-containing protein n=1 Tax=Halioglobus maricola TaxID=2601894 RepID=A0A5P9NGV2_9GAMM|nr:DUF1499 domain-containing protein [Halioglobus maricola]QFU75043.1 DUF1499 domain-containing protein [Halioglobus maricola]
MHEKTSSKLVNWVGYLAITMLVILPIAVLTVRSGAWQQGLMLFAIGCLGSTILLVLALVLGLFPLYRPHGNALRRRGLLAIPGTAILLSMVAGMGDYPPIHDITTDPDNPPAFSAAQSKRGNDANSLRIDPEVIETARQAYSDLATLETHLSIDEAYAQALATAQDLGWDVYRDDLNAGYIEAAASTAIMGFTDDVAIRITSNEAGTMIDLRSVSRVGRSDLGANAARIRKFIQAFTQQ